MLVVLFAVTVLVSLADPILLIGYVGAGLLARDWKIASLYGGAACALVLVLIVIIRGEGWHPRPFSIAAQFVASAVGAGAVWWIREAARRLRAPESAA